MGVRFAEGFRLVRVRFNGFYPHSKNPKKKNEKHKYWPVYWKIYCPVANISPYIGPKRDDKKNDLVSRLHKKNDISTGILTDI